MDPGLFFITGAGSGSLSGHCHHGLGTATTVGALPRRSGSSHRLSFCLGRARRCAGASGSGS